MAKICAFVVYRYPFHVTLVSFDYALRAPFQSICHCDRIIPPYLQQNKHSFDDHETYEFVYFKPNGISNKCNYGFETNTLQYIRSEFTIDHVIPISKCIRHNFICDSIIWQIELKVCIMPCRINVKSLLFHPFVSCIKLCPSRKQHWG